MTTGERLSRSVNNRGFARRRLAPMVEVIERRQLLDGGIGSIAGTVYFDTDGNSLIDPSDAYLPGATIQLYQSGSTTPVASAVTDAHGAYLFTGLAPGTYTITETPPTGQTVVGNQMLSQLSPARSLSAQSIQVTLLDPTKMVVNYGGVSATQYLPLNDIVNGKSSQDAVGMLGGSIGTAVGSTNLIPVLSTFCVDDQHRLSFTGGDTYAVTPQPITALSNGTSIISADHAGRIAYLFNHYGNASLTNVQAAGLQLAVWELLYDNGSTPDFTSGNFQSTGPIMASQQDLYNQAITQATAYFNESTGKAETGVLLSATSTIGTPAAGTDGYQSVLTQGSFDFLNKTQITPPPTPKASISGYVYYDANNDGIKQSTEPGITGTIVTLSGTNDLGQAVNLQTQSDNTGFYQFANLRPGTYTIVETQPDGYLDGKDTQGTPGNGVTSNDRFSAITLVDGENGQNNNFGELLAGVSPTVSSFKLYGIHMHETQVVLNVTGQLDAAQAANPASYKLIALGHDQVLGTADDQIIAITSAVYDPMAGTLTLTPAEHLNIHYHYLLSVNVAAATPATSALSYTTVFGRAELPVLDQSGKPYPVPRMTPVQLERDAVIVQKALSVWQKYQGNLPAPKAPVVKARHR